MSWTDHALNLAAAVARQYPMLQRGVVRIDALRGALGVFAPADEEERIRRAPVWKCSRLALLPQATRLP